jgi:type II secretory pathway pseudopilin PulG
VRGCRSEAEATGLQGWVGYLGPFVAQTDSVSMLEGQSAGVLWNGFPSSLAPLTVATSDPPSQTTNNTFPQPDTSASNDAPPTGTLDPDSTPTGLDGSATSRATHGSSTPGEAVVSQAYSIGRIKSDAGVLLLAACFAAAVVLA